MCGSDLHPYHSAPTNPAGTSIGHEFVGVVDDIGSEVSSVRRGDFVIAPFAWSDNTCDFCREGLHTSCRHGGFWNAGDVKGGQAEAVRVPLADGTLVSVAADSIQGGLRGTVTAVNSVIDEATRNVTVQASFKNPGAKLRPGMFVDIAVDLGPREKVIALPQTAINFAPYGNSVFVVENKKDPKGKPYKGVTQRFVKTGMNRGDQVAVLSGIKPGEEVVTSGVFKLRPDAAVTVNNSIVPANSPNPKPEDS